MVDVMRRLLTAWAVALCAMSTSFAQGFDEYEVKAVFLLNFAKYIEWPSGTFPSRTSPLTICVVGSDPFGSQLETAIGGKSANGRPIALRRVGPGEPADMCHVAFLSPLEDQRTLALPHDLEHGPALLVSDGPGGVARGSAIALVLEHQRVRFTVNLGEAERRGLRISAKLLTAARRVEGSESSRTKP